MQSGLCSGHGLAEFRGCNLTRAGRRGSVDRASFGLLKNAKSPHSSILRRTEGQCTGSEGCTSDSPLRVFELGSSLRWAAHCFVPEFSYIVYLTFLSRFPCAASNLRSFVWECAGDWRGHRSDLVATGWTGSQCPELSTCSPPSSFLTEIEAGDELVEARRGMMHAKRGLSGNLSSVRDGNLHQCRTTRGAYINTIGLSAPSKKIIPDANVWNLDHVHSLWILLRRTESILPESELKEYPAHADSTVQSSAEMSPCTQYRVEDIGKKLVQSSREIVDILSSFDQGHSAKIQGPKARVAAGEVERASTFMCAEAKQNRQQWGERAKKPKSRRQWDDAERSGQPRTCQERDRRVSLARRGQIGLGWMIGSKVSARVWIGVRVPVPGVQERRWCTTTLAIDDMTGDRIFVGCTYDAGEQHACFRKPAECARRLNTVRKVGGVGAVVAWDRIPLSSSRSEDVFGGHMHSPALGCTPHLVRYASIPSDIVGMEGARRAEGRVAFVFPCQQHNQDPALVVDDARIRLFSPQITSSPFPDE
ncbi:hypothetical protein B0H12DRAFT_1078731 [Mycena haematopus]|nr:hypothetical protein B0H12DRAFT_1078731 [Mycena haematopus]